MSAPCVLVATCYDEFQPITLVKQILKVDELPVSTPVLEQVQSYPWHVDTKYYTADVLVCTTTTRTIGDQSFAEQVEAFIVYFNGNQKSSFNQVKAWIPYLKEIDPEVKLLVCERSSPSDDIPRHMVQEWCLDYQFELVELDPETEELDVEDDYPDSFGITRIIQALHAHTWSNLCMKDEPDVRSPYVTQLMREQQEEIREILRTEATDTHDTHDTQDNHNTTEPETNTSTQTEQGDTSNASTPSCTQCTTQSEGAGVEGGQTTTGTATQQTATCENESTAKSQSKSKKKNDILDSLLSPDDLAMFNALASDEPDGESFEKLFAQLGVMKERSTQLPPGERKLYAEKMAVSFWRAIGGDEDEIADLSDDSDNLAADLSEVLDD